MSDLGGFRRQYHSIMGSAPETSQQRKAFLVYLEHRSIAAVAASTGLDRHLVKEYFRRNRWWARSRTYDAVCRKFLEPLKSFVPAAMACLAYHLALSMMDFDLSDYSRRDFVLLAGTIIEVLDVLSRRTPRGPSTRPN